MHTVVINIRSVFYDSKKYHPQVILERCLCKLVETYYHLNSVYMDQIIALLTPFY